MREVGISPIHIESPWLALISTQVGYVRVMGPRFTSDLRRMLWPRGHRQEGARRRRRRPPLHSGTFLSLTVGGSWPCHDGDRAVGAPRLALPTALSLVVHGRGWPIYRGAYIAWPCPCDEGGEWPVQSSRRLAVCCERVGVG